MLWSVKQQLNWDEAHLPWEYSTIEEKWTDYYNWWWEKFYETRLSPCCCSKDLRQLDKKPFSYKVQLTWDQAHIPWEYDLVEEKWTDYYNWWYKIINIFRNMTRYLHNSDYWVIQDTQLGQVIQNSQTKLRKAEMLAEEEIHSYLTQRFDLDYEFTNTGTWSYGVTYSAHDRVILDYPLYSTTATYSIYDCTIYAGDAWMLSGTSSISGTFSSQYWSKLGPQYGLFYGKYPAPLFDYLEFYEKNEQVYWKGHTWSCQSATTTLTDTGRNQYLYVKNIPYYNVFPDDEFRNSNQKYWSKGGTYSIPAGTLPNDENYWTAGDNRSQQMIMYMIDIALYHLHKSISPQNIPVLRLESYKMAIKWLNSIAMGEITAKTLQLQPRSGMVIRSGGNTKNPNSW